MSPVLRQSSQPCAEGSTSRIWSVWVHSCRSNIRVNLLSIGTPLVARPVSLGGHRVARRPVGGEGGPEEYVVACEKRYGAVTTANVATDEALPEVHPCGTHLQALLAFIGAWLHVVDLVQVRALSPQNFHQPPHKPSSSRGRLPLLPARLLRGGWTVLALYYDGRSDRAREGGARGYVHRQPEPFQE